MKKRMEVGFACVLFALTFISQTKVCAEQTSVNPSQYPHELSTLNDSFRESYAEAKSNIRKKLGPIIIVNGNDLVLLHNGSREAKPFVPDNYSILKTVDHIPLGIFVILNAHCDKPLDAVTRARLVSFKSFTDKAVDSVAAAKLSAKTQERQTTIITRSQIFIKDVLDKGIVSEKELRHFTSEASRDTLLNADEAIAYQFVLMDNIINSWRKTLTAAEFANTNFIIMSGHMPRRENSNFQYFAKITGEKEEGLRVIYAESVSDEEKAIDLLVTHILDRQIAIDFYQDSWRMHRDLLSDAASKYLSKHKPLDH